MAYEWILCALLGVGTIFSDFEKGNKSMPKWTKIARYRDTGGADHTFFKIIKYVVVFYVQTITVGRTFNYDYHKESNCKKSQITKYVNQSTQTV